MAKIMKYLWLVPKDQRMNNWILYNENMETGVKLRPQYSDLMCSNSSCNKLNEIESLKHGIDDDVKIRSRSDYLSSDDGFIIMSIKLWNLCETQSIRGLRRILLPGDDKFVIALPADVAETDIDTCHMEFLNQCSTCGRYQETLHRPFYNSMKLSNQPDKIECPEVWSENTSGRQFWFLVPEPIVKLWKDNKIKGVEYRKWQ